MSAHSTTAVPRALGDNSPAEQTTGPATKLTQPGTRVGLTVLLNKCIISKKKVIPVAPPLSHQCLLILMNHFSPLFPSPAIGTKPCAKELAVEGGSPGVTWMRWIVSTGNFWRKGGIKLLINPELPLRCCVSAKADGHLGSVFGCCWGSWAVHTAQLIQHPPAVAPASLQV